MSSFKELLIKKQNLDNELIEAIGELTPEMEQALLEIETNLPEKVDNYAYLIDKVEHEAEFFKKKAEKYLKTSKVLENLHQRLLDSIKQRMIEFNLLEVKGHDEVFRIARGKPVVTVLSQSEIPESHLKKTLTISVDKNSIREAIEGGKEIAGVRLDPSFTLRRSLNKKV